jgi:trimethylamine:corrinoid methyltransferase-like protein
VAGYEKGNPPLLAFLTEKEKAKIFGAALRVLEQTGMALMHDGARSRLTDAGCRADSDGVVRIPSPPG